MPIMLAATSPVTSEQFGSIFDALLAQFSVDTLVSLLAGVVGLGIGFVFLWWAVRKGSAFILRAVKSGKFKV